MVHAMDEDDLIQSKVLAAGSGERGAFGYIVLCIAYETIPGSSFETLTADVPLQDVADAAIRCVALGRSRI